MGASDSRVQRTGHGPSNRRDRHRGTLLAVLLLLIGGSIVILGFGARADSTDRRDNLVASRGGEAPPEALVSSDAAAQGAADRRVAPIDVATKEVPTQLRIVHPDLELASANVVARVLGAALRQRDAHELKVEALSDGDRRDPVVRAQLADAMGGLVMNQSVVRTLESGIAYLQIQPDRAGGKDYFGGSRPYLTFMNGAEVGERGVFSVVVPADNPEEVVAANAASRQAVDYLAQEIVAYYGTLGLDELKRRRQSQQLHLRGMDLPMEVNDLVRLRLMWLEDGLGPQVRRR